MKLRLPRIKLVREYTRIAYDSESKLYSVQIKTVALGLFTFGWWNVVPDNQMNLLHTGFKNRNSAMSHLERVRKNMRDRRDEERFTIYQEEEVC